jgi:hypothetical protein
VVDGVLEMGAALHARNRAQRSVRSVLQLARRYCRKRPAAKDESGELKGVLPLAPASAASRARN